MKITCTSCNAIVPAENINLAQNIAKCSACNSVFNCADQLASIAGGTYSSQNFSQGKSTVELPKKMTAAHDNFGYRITLKWFSLKYIFLIFFCLIWDGAVTAFVIALVGSGQYMPLLFLSIHGTVGIGLTYFTIAGFINTTIIIVTSAQIQVKIVPLPWFGIKTINAREIDQLFCKQKVTRGRNGTTITYEVHVRTRDEKTCKLITGLEKETQAFFIEQEIEKYLGIKDVYMAGEMPR